MFSILYVCIEITGLHTVSVIYLKKFFFCRISTSPSFPHPTFHTLASPSIWGCKCANHTYSYLTHPHLVTGQTARQFHEIFPIWCSLVLNTCVIVSWYHTVSVSAASWFSFNPSWLTESAQSSAHNALSTNYTIFLSFETCQKQKIFVDTMETGFSNRVQQIRRCIMHDFVWDGLFFPDTQMMLKLTLLMQSHTKNERS